MNRNEDNRILTVVLDIFETATVLWWRFFDWVAVMSWRTLGIVAFVVFLIAAPALRLPGLGLLFVVVSVAIKVLAGGKRSADLKAAEATSKANVEALERRLMEAQMAALQAQIEPHFLFNTLALIGQLIETDPLQAAQIHAHLIQYLRSAMPQMREKNTGRLGQQVALSSAYLNIMQARMRERLTVHVDVPVYLADAAFPSMMLQTLVENSIKHGLEPKTEGGHIDISAALVGTHLQVTVKDNGVGFDVHADDGVGLTNIRERLKVLYGKEAQLLIEAPPHGGAQVSISVPYSPN
ncbi:histidine kinase [Undibacterium sp. Jales W-56]|uniref:sensor histidine kinase n=1 Tax=Undibacterium sp. Jales W-56 TaxID=2897325 RepID=UPI0021CF5CD4|nr:histidine kinase [Undibacterium sp. Jales W-56]MCU6434172.1 histidine kinase [Undibacterium sp. Jales W-56]